MQDGYNPENDPHHIAYTYPHDSGPANPPTQENPVTEQENPAVSKLREAFDTARNAIIEGSELALLVTELRDKVNSLGVEVSSLQRDLEYIRNRNRELDEQVTEVRRQREDAIFQATTQSQRADKAEAGWSEALARVNSQVEVLSNMDRQVAELTRARDDAEYKAIELEDKLKIAEAKLAQMQAIICPVEAKPVEQPRNDRGEFQTYPHGSQGQSPTESNF